MRIHQPIQPETAALDLFPSGGSPASLDATMQQLVETYAEALVNAAANAGQTDEVIDELLALTREVFAAQPDFERLLGAALIGHREKAELIRSVLGERASPILLRFLNILNDHDRLHLLRPIAGQAVRLRDQRQGRRPVLVRSAVALDDPIRRRLRERLAAMLQAEPMLDERVEPDLLGGMIVQVGDTVYDSSIRTQLERLERQLQERSNHEIQSGRDRVGDSAGD